MGDVRLNRAASRGSVVVAIICLTAALAACGGDEEDAAAAQSPNPPGSPSPGNRAPTISGTPVPQVLQGQQFSFTPTASDADGNSLTFTVTNAPAWATFSDSTGRLRGTPTAGDVGTYAGIRISVSDGATTVNLPAFTIAVVATATGSASLTWNPPTQNTDGSPLSNLVGYRIYWGTALGDYTNSITISNPGLSSYMVEQLTPATWFFALTAINTAGAESTFSNVASKQVM